MFRKLRLLCNHINCDYEIIYNGFSWVSDGRRPYVIIRKKAKNKYISTYRPFSSALKKSIETKKNCIICRYNSFVAFGKKLDFTLICTAKIVGENAVEFSLKAENETGYEIQAVYFPAPFNSKIKGKNSYHVDSMRQGFILPDGYKKISFPHSDLPIISEK